MKLDLMCKRCCALALAFVLSAKCLAAQNAVPPLVPCRDFGCKLIFDWGPGKTVASYPQDRRYGGGDDFEVKLRSTLAGQGYHLVTTAGEGEMTIVIRATVGRAMCDQLSGTNTDYSCQTMREAMLGFSGGATGVPVPKGRSLRNSCGDATVQMTMGQFGQYMGEMIAFIIEKEKKGERRPSMKC